MAPRSHGDVSSARGPSTAQGGASLVACCNGSHRKLAKRAAEKGRLLEQQARLRLSLIWETKEKPGMRQNLFKQPAPAKEAARFLNTGL